MVFFPGGLPSLGLHRVGHDWSDLAAAAAAAVILHPLTSWCLQRPLIYSLSLCCAVLCCALLLSCVRLCDLVDCSLPGSSVHGILQARILEWDAISYSRGSSWLRDGTCIPHVSCIGGQILYQQCHLRSEGEAQFHSFACRQTAVPEPFLKRLFPLLNCLGTPVKNQLIINMRVYFWTLNSIPLIYISTLQSRPTLCNPMDCSPPGSSVHGILEWVAMPTFKGSSWPRDWTASPALQVDFLSTEPPQLQSMGLQSQTWLSD